MTSPPPVPERSPTIVLALDPGSAKCGLAVVQREAVGAPRVLHREVTERERVVARVLALLGLHHPEIVVVGNATGGAAIRRALAAALPATVPVRTVDEAFTSQRARRRFLEEHPAHGLARLVPRGFRTPPRPYDDYVAVLIAEDFLAAE